MRRAPLITYGAVSLTAALHGPDGPNPPPRAVRPTLPLEPIVITLVDDPEVAALHARMARANRRIDALMPWLLRAEITIAIVVAAVAVRPICAALAAMPS